MAFDSSDEHRQGRAIESGARRLAEDIAGTVYVRLETGACFTRFPAGHCPVNQSSPIRIGVIADTHGLYDPAIEEHLSGVTEILHAGDIGGRDVILRLQEIAPVVAVSGNVDDYEKSGFPQRVIIRRGGIKIAICHVLYERGQLMKSGCGKVAGPGRRQSASLAGHSHRPTIEQHGHIIVFNPGSAGPRRFSLPRGVGLLTITEGKVMPRLICLSDRANHQSIGNLRERSKQKGAVGYSGNQDGVTSEKAWFVWCW